MKNMYNRIINFTILSVLMPFVYGCGGGGGSAGTSSLSSVLGSSSSGSGDGGSGTISSFSSISGDGGQSLALIHNPEPATMLLISGGLAAMAFYKNRQRK